MKYTFTFGNETLTFNNLEDHNAFLEIYQTLIGAQLQSIYDSAKAQAITDGINYTSNNG
jgi:hypothetical protein